MPQQPGQPSIVPRTDDPESEYLYEHVPEHGIVVCWDPPANANARTGILDVACWIDLSHWFDKMPVVENATYLNILFDFCKRSALFICFIILNMFLAGALNNAVIIICSCGRSYIY